MGQEEMEVSLYSKKVLIKENCKELLPNYLRFVKGVIDCEDLPLNISRENYQNSALIKKLNTIMTRRILKLLMDEMKKDEAAYTKWFNEFQMFIKEGMVSDKDNGEALLKLARFDSSVGSNISIDDYVKKMKDGQDKIYYLLSNSIEGAKSSPFMDQFRDNKVPVLFIYVGIDEIVFRTLNEYKKLKFINIESNYEEVSKEFQGKEVDSSKGVPSDDVTGFCLWIKNELQPVVSQVTISKRLKDSPAIVISQASAGMRQMMAMMDKSQVAEFSKNLTFELNANHNLITGLNLLRKKDLKNANVMLRQILDNCLLASGLLNETKFFLNRINNLMESNMDNLLANKLEGVSAQRAEVSQEGQETNADSVLRETLKNFQSKSNASEGGISMEHEVSIGADGKPMVK